MDNGMNKKAADPTYTDLLNQLKDTKEGQDALTRLSPGEIGWGVAGAAGGGALGYLLSRLVHRKASARTKLLYTMLGALAGGGGSQYLLAHMKGSDGFNGTKKEEMRLSGLSASPSANTEDIKTDSKGEPKPGNFVWHPGVTAGLGAVGGFVRGAKLGDKRSLVNALTGAPNVYEWYQDRRVGRREDTERTMKAWLRNNRNQMQQGRPFENGAEYRGRWTITHDGSNPTTLKLVPIQHDTNYVRDAVNGTTAALTHGTAAYLLHLGANALNNHYGFSDPNRAYVTKEDIIRAAEQMKKGDK